MHNATTKQRHAALRRKLGIFLGAPRWVRERRGRISRLQERILAALSFEGAPGPARAREVGTFEAPPTQPASPAFVPQAAERAEPAPPAPTEETAPPRRRQGPPRTTWALTGAVASCAAILAIAFIAEIRGARPSSAVGPRAAAAAVAPSPAAPSPALSSPAAAPAPAEPAPLARGAAASAETIRVVRGDTLWHLAARHLRDPERWPAIHEANRDLVRDPDLIYPGQELKLPPR